MKIILKLTLIYLKKLNSAQVRLIIYLGLFCLALVIGLSYVFNSTNLICIESNLRKKVDQICDKYLHNKFSGEFCREVCAKDTSRQKRQFECANDGISSDVLFIGVTGNNQKYHFREANTFHISTDVDSAIDGHNTKTPIDPIKWIGKTGKLHYPTQEEFIKMINRTIFFRYNMVLPNRELHNLLNFKRHGDFEVLHHAMENTWRLIHDNDYMMGKLLDNKELFPKVLGNCGPYYAVEYITPFANEGHLERLSDQDWKRRLQKAVLILDFVEELDSNQPEPITMCDIKYNQFGISENRLKYLKLNHVHSTFFVDRYLSDSKSCWKDVQCSYKYCRSKCSKKLETCTYSQLNNNVQIVCDKIFRGSTYSPGLLMTSRTSKILSLLLDQCASPGNSLESDPYRPWGPSKEIRNALYIEITNIYDGLILIV